MKEIFSFSPLQTFVYYTIETIRKKYPVDPLTSQYPKDIRLGVIATILSQRAREKLVVEKMRKIKEMGINKLRKMSLREIEELIKPINYYKTKALRIKNILDKIANRKIDEGLLQKLPGIGEKSLAVLKLFYLDKKDFPVDSNIRRFFFRYFGKNIKFELLKIYNNQELREIHLKLLTFGRKICKPKPKCDECPFWFYCLERLKKANLVAGVDLAIKKEDVICFLELKKGRIYFSKTKSFKELVSELENSDVIVIDAPFKGISSFKISFRISEKYLQRKGYRLLPISLLQKLGEKAKRIETYFKNKPVLETHPTSFEKWHKIRIDKGKFRNKDEKDAFLCCLSFKYFLAGKSFPLFGEILI